MCLRPSPGAGRRAVALALTACLAACAPRTAGAVVRYPRLAMPGIVHGNGTPYLDSLGTLNPGVLDAVSRFEEVIVDASPITEYHPEIAMALRVRNPDIKLFAYVVAENIWDSNAADSLHHIPTRWNHLIRDLGGFLYSRQGAPYTNYDVNLAKRDGTGRYVVAEALAQFFHDEVVASGLWDGMFVDVFCDGIGWTQTPAESIDFVRAGYPTFAAFDVAWKAGTDTLASRLRALSGPDFELVGNCATGTKYAWFNGWNRENFPYQQGGTWYTNMFWDPGGFFADERHFRQPPRNHIFTGLTGTQPYDGTNSRRVRFALASAALGQGLAIFGPGDRGATAPSPEAWWYDEYAVDVATGDAQADRAHTGWLGEATSDPYQMIWVGTNPDAVTNPGFETDVASGWTLSTFGTGSASIARDTASPAVGSASARIDIASTGANAWDVNFATTGQLSVLAGGTYAATFWARASAPRAVTVTMTRPTGGDVGSRDVTVGTTWQQYQVVLQPTASASVILEFFLNQASGSLWFDDVHFQRDATSVWRRDFQNGTVLVNPSDRVLNVPMGGSWRRIRGTVDPFTNNGALVTTASVGASDGLFLVGTARDTIPPAAIRDAHVTP
jgi:hypothetical protein